MSDSIPTDLGNEGIPASRLRLSPSQFGVMVDFMILNPELIHKNFSETFTQEHWHKKWEELTALLNADFTGAKKDAERWRRSWKDQKFSIRSRAEKRDACKLNGTDPSPYELNDLEEKILQVIKSNVSNRRKRVKCLAEVKNPSSQQDGKNNVNQVNKSSSNQQEVKNNVNQVLKNSSNQQEGKNVNQVVNNPSSQQSLSAINFISQEIVPTGYILINMDTSTVPLKFQSVNHSSSKLEPTNNIILGLESVNVKPLRQECTSSTPIRLEATDILTSSAGTTDLTNDPDKREASLNPERTANSSEIKTKKVQDLTEKENSSNSLIFETSECSAPKNIQNLILYKNKKTEESVIDSSGQNSSSSPPRKRRRNSNHSLFRREDEYGLVKLLEKQNNLLEGIAETLIRIEKSLDERSSAEAQRKNNMLVNISDNLEKLAGCVGSVSKSLKSIGEQ